jgi:hypothetical protein
MHVLENLTNPKLTRRQIYVYKMSDTFHFLALSTTEMC